MKSSSRFRRLVRSSLRRAPCACESGNALIELAFALPLFLVIILGTAEIANLAWASVQVNNAARAGAAYAAASRANAASPSMILAAAQAEAPSLAISLPVPQACYCVTGGSLGSPASGCTNTTLASCTPPSVIAVQVTVQAPVTPFVHYPGLPATYTVNAQATMGVTQ